MVIKIVYISLHFMNFIYLFFLFIVYFKGGKTLDYIGELAMPGMGLGNIPGCIMKRQNHVF